ncbi:hypothetical protein BLA39750_01204 [Burkholderia lata]|uniref:Uncharacterized protein n=1 Tax=Burkholderia lata (strain ATCC 17760 / DSM 23089 / LMG 22485 / NCIMB 9086 / R18194 / 383) TaxID=482957 RepID=A0A6P2VQZ1_BURL3|nr:hypothetical protein [Burkholderia lata]VWC81092.1 hypothetical protein BLA39750_01204 [Burkholderia lata]
MTRVHLDVRSLSLLKSHTTRQLPSVRYGHRLEAIALSLGFNTWSSFTHHLKSLSNDAPAARVIDIFEMRARLVELGYVQEAVAPLSFVDLEDDVHFMCDIDGLVATRMASFRHLLNADTNLIARTTAVARMAYARLTAGSSGSHDNFRVPVLDVLRDMGIACHYRSEFGANEVEHAMNELIDLRAQLADRRGETTVPVFSSVLVPAADPDFVRYTFNPTFFAQAKVALAG